jgi:hypothetical protein
MALSLARQLLGLTDLLHTREGKAKHAREASSVSARLVS